MMASLPSDVITLCLEVGFPEKSGDSKQGTGIGNCMQWSYIVFFKNKSLAKNKALEKIFCGWQHIATIATE